MRQAKHFQRDGRGVFKCATCDRQTRITHQDRSSPLCYECYECAGYENAVQDGGDLEKEQRNVASYVAVIEKKGGNMRKFYESFSTLFPDGAVAKPATAKAKKAGKGKLVRLTPYQLTMLSEIVQNKPPHCNEKEYATLKSLIESARVLAVRI